jgi:Sap, sulfolipid-1-addressing protein
VSRVVLLSLLASLNPTLVAATTLMLLLDRPARLMTGYLVGALLISITLGLVIVFSLSDTDVRATAENTLSPVADIALGALALVLAAGIRRGFDARLRARRRSRRAHHSSKGPPRWQRELSKGSPRVTFVVGVMLTLPGASYLAGLTQIHRLDYSPAVTVMLVLGFNLVMLWLLEVPLACFLLAPDWTPRTIGRIKTWVGRRGRTVVVGGLRLVGTLLIIKGIVGLL